MKNIKFNYLKTTFFLGLVIMATISCERGLSDDFEITTFSNDAEIYIDGFSGGLDYYPYSDSKPDVFSVDVETKFSGTSSMRFDIPSVGDAGGPYGGASFILGDIDEQTGGRNLTEFDALTFYAKATQAATLDNVGFGQDFGENKYEVTLQNVAISTNWVKYIIPIPDASKLIQERGMFWYSEGPENGAGYTFWVDDLKFERLGTVAQPRPVIQNGIDDSTQGLVEGNVSLSGLSQTFNLASGQDITVSAAPAYYNFETSNPFVASVNEYGIVSIDGAGEPDPITGIVDNTAVITATLGGVDAAGSLTVESLGEFSFPPTPTQSASDVISIFSDAYTNVAVDHYNGYWGLPFPQSTQGQNDLEINGDEFIVYSQLDFVGIEFHIDVPTVNASSKSFLHIDIQVLDDLLPGDFLVVKLQDIGADDNFGGGNDTAGEITLTDADLSLGNWVSFDFPLSGFAGLTSRANLAQVVFVSDATITDVMIDNIYFY